MIDVQVPDEDLVEEVVGDLLGRQPLVTAGPEIEEEFVAVAQLDEPARRDRAPCVIS